MFVDFRERERNIHQLPPKLAPTGDRTRNLSTCPNQGSNLQLIGAQANSPTNLTTGQGCSSKFGGTLHVSPGVKHSPSGN